ncbi:MAG: glycosyltransferase family A protein [Planctomycetota bacterium]
MASISILLPTHNRGEILKRTLACIERLHVPDHVQAELVVVANNCTDDTVAVTQEVIDRLSFPGKVAEEFTPGLNAARNRAMHESTGEICALIDDDIAFEPMWLAEIVEFFETSPADMASGRVRLWWEVVERPDWFTPNLDNLLSRTDRGESPEELFKHSGIVGANFWFKRSVWDKIGEFRLDLDRVGSAKLGGGDSDFVDRALRAGFRVFYTPKGEILHWVAPGRIEHDYLLGVAEGSARGRVRMKPPQSVWKWFRTYVGHKYLLLVYGAKALLVRATKGPNAALTYRTRAAAGWGGLLGLVDRLRGRSQG